MSSHLQQKQPPLIPPHHLSFSSFILHPSSLIVPPRPQPPNPKPQPPNAPGFTLIEILVTIAVFTAVMAVLVEGLHSGIRAWRAVRDHQVRQAEFNLLAASLTEDARHLLVSEQGSIAEETIEGGGEKLRMLTSVSRKRQQAGIGYVSNEVLFAAETAEDGSKNLVRTVTRRTGKSEVGAEPLKETLLANIKSVQFDYLGPEGHAAVWEDNQALPQAVLFRIQPPKGPELVIPARIPAAILSRRTE